MKSKVFFFLFFISSCFASQDSFFDERCPYGCGQRHMDKNFILMQRIFAQCLFKIFRSDLSNKDNFNLWVETPEYLREDYVNRSTIGSNIFICYGTSLFSGQRTFFGKYDTGWHVKIDYYAYDLIAENYDEEDLYYNYFLPKGYSKDIEYVKQVVETHETLHEEDFALSNPFDFPKIISILEKDLKEVLDEKNEDNEEVATKYRERIKEIHRSDLEPKWKEKITQNYENEIKHLVKYSNENIEKYKRKLQLLGQYEQRIYIIYDQMHKECIKKHGFVGAFYYRGFNNFLLGKTLEFLSDIEKFIEKQKNAIPSEIYLAKGQAEEEVGLYNEAITSLSKAIKKNPENKEAYFERAACYFEKGDFNTTISDFLESGYKSTPIDSKDAFSLDFSKGLIIGSLKGGADGIVDFLPSLYSTASGLTNGLWALVSNPIDVSKEVVEGCKGCIEYMQTHSPEELLANIVPELKGLVTKWDQLPDLKKGEIMGYVIGKYGVDIFLAAGSVKALKIARNLRNANKVMTFEKLAKDAEKAKIITKESLKRSKKIEKAIIDFDLQKINPKIYTQLERQYLKDGEKSIFKSLRKAQKTLEEHQQKLPHLKYKSKVEGTIKNVERQIETIKKFIVDKGLEK